MPAGPDGPFVWGIGPDVLNTGAAASVVVHMSNSCTTTPTASVLHNVEWSTVTDAAGPILRRAAHGAILHDNRVQIRYDRERDEYVLGLTWGC